jgi:hypothetical protein
LLFPTTSRSSRSSRHLLHLPCVRRVRLLCLLLSHLLGHVACVRQLLLHLLGHVACVRLLCPLLHLLGRTRERSHRDSSPS